MHRGICTAHYLGVCISAQPRLGGDVRTNTDSEVVTRDGEEQRRDDKDFFGMVAKPHVGNHKIYCGARQFSQPGGTRSCEPRPTRPSRPTPHVGRAGKRRGRLNMSTNLGLSHPTRAVDGAVQRSGSISSPVCPSPELAPYRGAEGHPDRPANRTRTPTHSAAPRVSEGHYSDTADADVLSLCCRSAVSASRGRRTCRCPGRTPGVSRALWTPRRRRQRAPPRATPRLQACRAGQDNPNTSQEYNDNMSPIAH